MSFSGDLASIDLASVLQTISFNQKTGTLKVTGPQETYHLFFDRGEITQFSTGRKAGNFLGQILVRMGKLRKEDLDNVLAFQKQKGGVIGRLLVELEAATAEDVEVGIREQVQEAVYDLFSWTGASFEFIDGDAPEGIFNRDMGSIPVRISPSSLVLDVARRSDEWKNVKKYLSSFKLIFEAQAGVSPAGDEEAVLLSLLDGTRNVETLIDASGLEKLSCCQTLIDLIERGKVRQVPYAAIVERAEHLLSVGQPQEAVPLIEAALELDPDNAALREALVEAYKGSENWDAISQQYQILARKAAEAGDVERAVACGEKGLGFASTDLTGYREILSLLKGMGRNAEAVRLGKRLCEAYRKGADNKSAKELYGELLGIDKLDFELWQGLARTLVNMEDREGALRMLDDGLGFCSQDNRPDLAEKIKEEILRLKPETGPDAAKAGRGAGGASSVVSVSGAENQPARPELVWAIAIGCLAVLAGAVVFVVLSTRSPQETEANNDATGPVGPTDYTTTDVPPWPTEDLPPDPPPGATDVVQEEDPEIEKCRKAVRKADQLRHGLDGEAALEAYRKIFAEYTDPKFRDALKTADDQKKQIEKYLQKAADLRRDHDEAVGKGDLGKANDSAARLRKEFVRAAASRGVVFRVRISARPEGVRIKRNDELLGRTLVVAEYPDGEPQHFAAELEGFETLRWDFEPGVGTRPVQQDFHLELNPSWFYRDEEPGAEDAQPVKSRPVVGNGRLAYVTGNGIAFGFALPEDGSAPKGHLWRIPFKDEDVDAAPLVDGETVYVGTKAGKLHALVKNEGDRNAPDIKTPISSTPAMLTDKLLVVGSGVSDSSEGRLVCLQTPLKGGSLPAWEFSTGGRVDCTPVVVDAGSRGFIVFGANDGKLYAVDKTGKSAFPEVAIGGSIRARPLVAGDLVVAATTEGKMLAVSLRSFDKAWDRPLDLHSGIYHEGVVAGDEIVVLTEDGRIASVGLKNGQLKREHKLGRGRPTGPPVLGRGVIYATFEDGFILALDPADFRKEFWRRRTGKNLSGSAALSELHVLVCADDGRLLAFPRKYAEARDPEAAVTPDGADGKDRKDRQ